MAQALLFRGFEKGGFMYKKLFLSLILVALSSATTNAEAENLHSADELSMQVEQELSVDDLQEINDLEIELQSRRGDILRDILIDQLLPNRHQPNVICFARNQRGLRYSADGRHPHLVQEKALAKCDRNSRRRCFAEGCHRKRGRH